MKRPEAAHGLHISSLFYYLENHPDVLYITEVKIAATPRHPCTVSEQSRQTSQIHVLPPLGLVLVDDTSLKTIQITRYK